MLMADGGVEGLAVDGRGVRVGALDLALTLTGFFLRTVDLSVESRLNVLVTPRKARGPGKTVDPYQVGAGWTSALRSRQGLVDGHGGCMQRLSNYWDYLLSSLYI